MPKLDPAQVTALCDTREQTPWNLTPLRTERATLPTGDYSLRGLEHHIAIERKTLPDLLSVVGRDRERFDREVQRLLGYAVRALVVEAAWGDIERGEWRNQLKPSQVLGSLMGWQASGLQILMADNHELAGRLVARLLFTVARRRWQENIELTNAVDAKVMA